MRCVVCIGNAIRRFVGYRSNDMEVSVRLVGSAAFKAVGTSDPRPAGSIPVHLRQFSLRRVARFFAATSIAWFAGMPAGVAHADPARPGNTESVVQTVEPSTENVRVDIVGADAFVRVRAESGHEVEVLGYENEPFVRIAKDGTVTMDMNSLTARTSSTRYGSTQDPKDATNASAPLWKVVGRDGSAMWHDHRVHWMSPIRPEPIDDDGLVQSWTFTLKVDGVTTLASGSLYLRDAPGSWWWLLVIPGLIVGFVVSRRGAQRELAGAGAAFVVIGAFMFWGVPSEARSAPVMFALGAFTVIVSVATAVFRHRSEIVDALVASAAIGLLVAVVVERDAVTSRFVPGLGDSVVLRMVVPAVAGLALGSGARALKRLLGKPQSNAPL